MNILHTTKNTKQLLSVLATCCAIGLIGSCSGIPAPSGGTDGGQPDTTQDTAPEFATFDITMKDGARQLSQDAMQVATSEETDGGMRYVFPDASPEVTDIQVDDVVLFSGVGLGRVTAITAEDSTVTVETESATLDEFVQDGTIAWGFNIDFVEMPEPQITPGFEDDFTMTKRRNVSSQLNIETGGDSFTFSGKVSGWDVSMTIAPTSSRLNLDVSASRSVNGTPVISISGKGFVNNFQQTANIDYTDGVASDVRFGMDGMAGEMKLQWSAFNPGEFVENALVQLRFPVEIPFRTLVGGIPIILKLKLVARVIPQLNFPDMSSQGSFKVVYSGSAGFSVTDSTVSGVGNLNSAAFSVAGDTVGAGSVTVGFGVGLEFPRLEVSLLGNSASAFITLDTFASGFFEPGISSNLQPCQYGTIVYQAISGYQLSFLGLVGVSGSTEIWKDEESFFLDGTPCN